jgi:hypothetical protein
MSTQLNTTYTDLKRIPLPEATKSYIPVSHYHVADHIKEELDKRGMNTFMESYRVSGDGMKCCGQITVKSSENINFMVAFHNSYDKSMAVKFAAGGNVFICTNGVIRSDAGITLYHKHRGDVIPELDWKLKSAIQYYDDKFQELLKQSEKMKEVEITKRTAAELVGRMFIEDELVNSAQLSIIKKELEFSKNFTEPTLWSLYNHVTEAYKQQSSPLNYIPQHKKLHTFIEKEFSYALV